jgi:hypothetical protein
LDTDQGEGTGKMSKAVNQNNTPSKPKKRSELIKEFKSSSEVEDFYRFVQDKQLRFEAKTLLEYALEKTSELGAKKKKSKKKKIQ